MKIEAICKSKEENGVKLPTYLIRATHKELIALGGVTFEPGEELSMALQLEHLRYLQSYLGHLVKGIETALEKV